MRSAPGDEKFVVCNGDEGDPGAYMNRAELEGNPHALIEVMALGVTRIGATATQTIIDDFRARKAGLAGATTGSGAAPGSSTIDGGY